jgi:tRNA threonylcarbamoyladenosine biosynthesis protein TsaB
MRVLAIDTSTMLGGVAVMDDLSGLIVEIRLNVKSTYSEKLMTTVDYVLKKSGYKLSDIDFFAVSTGPGSFTGLRIGLSTVKGFAYATGKPIVSVPTLEALAYNFPFCLYPVCTLLDARKKEVYAALFKWEDEGFIRLINEDSIRIDRFLEKLSVEKAIFTGDGAILYRDKILSILDKRAIFALPDKMVPSPAHVASIGMKKALNGEFSEPISLIPSYIRRSEAELKEK